MRDLTLRLAQNLGATTGAVLDVSGAAISLGSLNWAAEQNLTKLSHGDCSLTVADHDGTVWAWLQANLPSSAGQLPPWLLLDLDGAHRFVGLINPARVRRDEKRAEIQLSAQDWSSQLADLELSGDLWTRPEPLAVAEQAPGETRTMEVVRNVLGGQVVGLPRLAAVGTNSWVRAGDVCLCAGLTQEFRVLYTDAQNGGSSYTVILAGWPEAMGAVYGSNWPTTQDITRLPREDEATAYYETSRAVVAPEGDAKNYILPLVTVDGIVPGDQLTLLTGATDQTLTVLQVDAESRSITTAEALGAYLEGDRLYFTDQTAEELVQEDARRVLAQAAQPFNLDISRLSPVTLPSPVFAWLPLRSASGADLLAPTDLDPLLTSLRTYSSASRAWDGSPDEGWSSAAPTSTRFVRWTSQLAEPPATLMTDETATIAPEALPRNQWWGYGFRWGAEFGQEWDPSTADVPGFVVAPSYPAQARYVLTQGTIQTSAWAGSSWGSPATATWSQETPLDACILPGRPGELLVLTGLAIHLWDGSAVAGSVTLASDQQDGRLVTTPWGAYLLTPNGYGRIKWTGAGIGLDWFQVTQAGKFLPQTFAALNQDEIVCLSTLTATARDGATSQETWCLRLPAVPGTPINTERIMEGAPILAGAVRDPSTPGRVVGHCGGRLWQVSDRLPWTLERFRPSGMTAAELIEHVCQVMLATAVPDAAGTLHIVSRARWEAPTALEVDRVSVTRSFRWEHFYSRVIVSASRADTWGDVTGPVAGGKTLEISGQPLLWSDSGAQAMAAASSSWFGVPRETQQHEWFWESAETAAPWESVKPLSQITIPGDSRTWLLYGLEEDLVGGRAKATLLELPDAGYGQAYGFRRA